MNIQEAELADARSGILYFLGGIQVERKPSFDIGLISNFVSGTSVATDLKNAATDIVRHTDAGKKALDGIGRVIEPIHSTLATFFDKMVDHFHEMYGEAAAGLEWIGEFGAWAVSSLVGSLADVIPGWGYVQSAADLYDGVKQSVTSCLRWLRQVHSGWGVKLLEGTPTIVASAIATHNATALAGGLKDSALAVTKISLQAAGDTAAGVGSIVSMVTGILQRIANMVGYCVQRFLLARTLNQASYHWNNKAELTTDPAHFNKWFKLSCVCTPVVAAIAMQSGYIANPMRFLALFKEDNTVISQQDFNNGVKHIERLKTLSMDYCRSYADAYKLNFKSQDRVVAAQLNHMFLG